MILWRVDDVGKSGPLLISLTSIHDEICRVELLVVVCCCLLQMCNWEWKFYKTKKTGTQTSFSTNFDLWLTTPSSSLFIQFVFKIPEAGSSSSSSSLKNQDPSLGLVWFWVFEKIETLVPVLNSGPKIRPSSSLVFTNQNQPVVLTPPNQALTQYWFKLDKRQKNSFLNDGWRLEFWPKFKF